MKVYQIPSAQTTVNSRDPGLYPSADDDHPLLSILPTPNPNPGSPYSAIANWDQLSTCPQTRIPDDLLAGVIANTAAQEQAAPQMTVNTTHPTPNPNPGSGHSASANWDRLSTLPQTRIHNDLLVSVIANTVAQEQAAPQTTVNTTHPTPNPNPGSGHSASANWDRLSTLPQTRIHDDLPVSVIENTAAQEQAPP